MRQTELKAAAQHLKRIMSKVEVERKFNPSSKFLSLFLRNGWVKQKAQSDKVDRNQERPLFNVLRKPDELIRDTYYDTRDHQLCQLGLWVRQRSTHALPPNPPQPKDHQTRKLAELGAKAEWNAKLLLGVGHFTNTQFVEIDGREKVSSEVQRITDAKTKLDDLQVVTDLQTKRLSWEVTTLADGTAPSATMTIVLDEVTEAQASGDGSDESAFNHTVGEVELFEELVTEDKDDAGHQEHRNEVAARRMGELKEFMLANADLFVTSPKPVGKLTAYDVWRASRS
ncbi:hypothetical protein F4802DRAFT_291061 [Xylaria palmicola]|nr:hypothetical protein F4802DRAFT_291061 [Xylaria palmicola]